MRESKITTIFKGEFVMVDMIDETIELTVEDNVYSRSESLELLAELQSACSVSRIAKGMIGMRGIEHEQSNNVKNGSKATKRLQL